MTEATIRIQTEGPGGPRGGFVGAVIGGTEPGSTQSIEVDLRDVTGGDAAGLLPIIAEAYRTAHFGERVPDDVIAAEVVDADVPEIPFPQAGDPHPFTTAPEEIGALHFHEGGYSVVGTVTRAQVVDFLNDQDTVARQSTGRYFDGAVPGWKPEEEATPESSQVGTPKNDGDPRKSVVVFIDALQADPVRLSGDEVRLLTLAIEAAS